MRLRLSLVSLLLAALAFAPPPLHAQGTAADSAHWRATKIDLDSIARDKTAPLYSKRAQARIRARDSLRLVAPPVVVPPKDSTPVVVVPPPKPDSTPTTKPPVDSAPQPPVPSVFAVPANLGGGVAAVAELPRDTVPTPYPAQKQQVRLSNVANLQAALNSAQPGDEILLPRGATFTGDFLLPKHAGAGQSTCSAWIVLRTDVPDSLLGAPGTRMTPSRAKALNLAKLQTPDNQQAIGSALGVPNVGCWRLVGLEVLPGPTGNDVNGLVRFGDQNATDSTALAHHLVLDRSYVHGSPIPSPKNVSPLLPGQVRRCAVLNSRWNVVVDSWLEYCRGGNGDTQAVLSYMGGPLRISNSTLSGGTEVVMFGGATSAIVGMTPSDITIHGNYFTRELADTITLVKNWLEVKNGERLDAAGNVFRYNWPDGQTGYGILFKSVNQSSGSCTWCRARDITFRYNRLSQTANGINLAGIQEAPAQPAARYTLYGNWIDTVGFRKGEGKPLQILGGNGSLSDVILANNTVLAASWGLVSYDGGPIARQAWQSNVLWCGGYGAKGNGTGSGLPTLTTFAPGMVWSGNVLYGCGSGYPAGTTYAGSLGAALASPSVGAQLGALLNAVLVQP